jgi:hypothetical protein
MGGKTDKRYRTDPDFRAAVAQKLSVSSIGNEHKSYNDTTTLDVMSGGMGSTGTESREQILAEQRTAEEQLAAAYGPLAVKPAARAKAQEVTAKEGSQFNAGRNGSEPVRVTVRAPF